MNQENQSMSRAASQDDAGGFGNPDGQAGQPENSQQKTEGSPDLIAQLKAQRDELEARLLRVAADYQNYVKRSQQNIDNARQQQIFELVKALLTPLDHFDRALSIDAQTVTAGKLLEGVQMVQGELLKALEQFGVKKMQVKTGQPFDPVHHEAVARQAVAGVEPDHIAAELQAGYVLEDKVLRPAKVAITG